MTNIYFKKSDLWLTLIAGGVSALLSFPILQNLKIFDLLSDRDINSTFFSIAWVIIVPALAIIGLYIFFVLAKRFNQASFFQLGKYGVVGVLNTVLNTGVFNLMIFLTNISVGRTIDFFYFIAFIITIINSFYWNKFWAFAEREEGLAQEAFKFFLVSGATALISTGVLDLMINVIGAPSGLDLKLWDNIGLVFTIVIAFFGNFFGYKFFVFKK